MTQGDQEPAVSEEVMADVSEEPKTEAVAPPLNREQRRAQARGKQTGTGIKPGGMGGQSRSAVSRGAAGPTRFPRTGHK